MVSNYIKLQITTNKKNTLLRHSTIHLKTKSVCTYCYIYKVQNVETRSLQIYNIFYTQLSQNIVISQYLADQLFSSASRISR